MDLRDRVVIVTGAARGIGAEYTRAFLEAGARVVAADILDMAALQTEMKTEDLLTVKVDVTSAESTEQMARAATERWGRIDVLVNNAALYGGLTRAGVEEIPEGEWDRMMAVNVKGVWQCVRAVLPAMKAQGGGNIINISSGSILSGSPNMLHYVASKGAVWAMTRALATELGRYNIRVNCVTPGLVSTEASKQNYGERFEEQAASRVRDRVIKREMYAEDVVGPVLFLASEASKFMTGQNINVDGGRYYY